MLHIGDMRWYGRYLIEPGGTELLVTASDPDGVDALGAQLGHGGGPGQLELPLLPDRAALAARGASLMPVVAGNTHLLPATKFIISNFKYGTYIPTNCTYNSVLGR
jgi:hypothetical protein